MTLDTPIGNISHIGPKFLRRLQRMGIKTVRDLLFHFPHRYEDFSNIIPVAKIKPNQNYCILGKLLGITNSRTWKKRMIITEAIIQDKSGAMKAVWFNQPYLTKSLKPGDIIVLAGKAALGNEGLFLSNPAYEKISNQATNQTLSRESLVHTGRIVPVYPETEGLSSRWLRYIIKPLLINFKNKIPEILPQKIIKKYNLLPINQAIWQVHFPDSLTLAKKAKDRFSFEELFLIELAALRERFKLNKKKAPAIPINIKLIKKFVDSLPFKLTNAQRKASWQVLKDLEKSRPMSRLLEGDVGSGKTMVAIIAALNASKAGYQTAFMTPTEILAKQHFKEVSKLLHPFKIKIAILTGKEDKIISQKISHSIQGVEIPEVMEISRQKLLERAQGKINPRTKKYEVGVDILIGTHSLIQDKVKFGKLALCVIDEQHRFGVEQRAKLVQKKSNTGQPQIIPHFLSMTATPIPRTLALTLYGDLDISILDEMPKGRKKIITKIIPPEGRPKVYKFIHQQVRMGHQAFIICPRIESPETDSDESARLSLEQSSKPASSRLKSKNEKSKEKKNIKSNSLNSGWLEVKAVKDEYEKLSKKIFPDLKIAMLHGKMKVKEKEKIMEKFKRGKIDILVATSVVEVGIDIPKATVMAIEGAERFGLAQLYQFRGRVGRSNIQSYCFLFTDSPASRTRQRLRAILKAKNGFEVAQKDLDIRGPGSLYGAKQWGIPDLAMENLKNLPLIEEIRGVAQEILASDQNLRNYPSLQTRLKKFTSRIHFE